MVWTVVSPGSSGLAIPANKVSTKGTNWEIITMNAMRLTLSNNVDGSGSGKCGWYRSSVGSVGAGGDVRLQGHSSSSGVGSARIGHSSLGPVTMDSNLGWGQSSSPGRCLGFAADAGADHSGSSTRYAGNF